MSHKTSEPSKLSPLTRWVLIGSLGLNLLAAGVFGGALLRQWGPGDHPPPPRNVALGFWSEGLQRQDHEALRDRFRSKGVDFKASWQGERSDRQALITILRTEPFDAAAFVTLADSLQNRAVGRMTLTEDIVRGHIIDMTPEARQAFADRLEESLHRKRAAPRGKEGAPRP